MTAFLRKNRTFIVILFFLTCGLFLVWKAHQGYIFNDEPFMVSLGHRLVKGDMFFVDEWNTSQLTAVFFAPLVFLYTAVTKSTVGVVLFCRLVYVAWWLFVGVILYRRLRQYGWISIVVAAMFILYTPLDEMTLTYNAMGLSLLVLFVSYFLTEGNAVFDYVNGIVLAFAVLAYPGLLVIYVFYFISVIIRCIFKLKIGGKWARMLSWRLFLRITIASVAVAVLFCLFVFSSGNSNVFESIFAMFSVGADNKKSLMQLIQKLFEQMPVMIICGPLIIIISIIDRNRQKRGFLYIIAQILVFTVTIIFIIKDIYSFNAVMIPLFFVGIQAFILVKRRDAALTSVFGVSGIIAAFVWYYSSDTKIPSFSNGFVLINVVSVIYIYRLYSELSVKMNKPLPKRLLSLLLACVVFGQVGTEFYIKVRRSYWDELFPTLNNTIQVGAAKNIRTCDYNADNYNMVYEDVEEMQRLTKADRTKKFLSLSLFPSIYLDMDYQYGTFSSWTYTGNSFDYDALNRKLTRYYELNPSKVADVIYINSDDRESLSLITCIDFSKYSETELKSGSVFIKK